MDEDTFGYDDGNYDIDDDRDDYIIDERIRKYFDWSLYSEEDISRWGRVMRAERSCGT